jgi:hypothetical protein
VRRDGAAGQQAKPFERPPSGEHLWTTALAWSSVTSHPRHRAVRASVVRAAKCQCCCRHLRVGRQITVSNRPARPDPSAAGGLCKKKLTAPHWMLTHGLRLFGGLCAPEYSTCPPITRGFVRIPSTHGMPATASRSSSESQVHPSPSATKNHSKRQDQQQIFSCELRPRSPVSGSNRRHNTLCHALSPPPARAPPTSLCFWREPFPAGRPSRASAASLVFRLRLFGGSLNFVCVAAPRGPLPLGG